MKIKKIKKGKATVTGAALESGVEKSTTGSEYDTEGSGDSMVGIKLGITVPGPEPYSPIRVDVSVEVPCGAASVPDTYAKLKEWAEEKLSEQAEELYEGMSG